MNDKNRNPLVILISILDLLDLLRTFRKNNIIAVRVKQLDVNGKLVPGSKRSIWRLYSKEAWTMLHLYKVMYHINPDFGNFGETDVPYQELLVTKSPVLKKGTVIVMDTSRMNPGIGVMHERMAMTTDPISGPLGDNIRNMPFEDFAAYNPYLGLSRLYSPYWPSSKPGVGKKDKN